MKYVLMRVSMCAVLAAGCGKQETTPPSSPSPAETPPAAAPARQESPGATVVEPVSPSPVASEKPTPADPPPAAAPVSVSDPLAIAQRSGCLVCHSVEKKVVGPAWKDVSVRYQGEAGARERLIGKVKTGGAGNWTNVTGGISMPPYSPRVADEDIARLVDFVLSLSAGKAR